MGPLTTELMAILDDLSQPVRIAWAVWFVWAIVQTVWYWRSRPQEPVYRMTVARTRSASRIAVPSRSASSGSRRVARRSPTPETAPEVKSHIGGTPEFLAALGLKKRAPVTSSDEDGASVYR